jgi:hypothetical protein
MLVVTKTVVACLAGSLFGFFVAFSWSHARLMIDQIPEQPIMTELDLLRPNYPNILRLCRDIGQPAIRYLRQYEFIQVLTDSSILQHEHTDWTEFKRSLPKFILLSFQNIDPVLLMIISPILDHLERECGRFSVGSISPIHDFSMDLQSTSQQYGLHLFWTLSSSASLQKIGNAYKLRIAVTSLRLVKIHAYKMLQLENDLGYNYPSALWHIRAAHLE